MSISHFTAFYPSRPFWAGSKVDFADQTREGWFHDQMVEEVFSEEHETHTIKVCRDGRIMLRVEALEQADDSGSQVLPPEQTVRRWGEYLDHLNAFYLLLDSTTIELSNFHYFSLHEITSRDAFRVRYEGGKSIGENIATESVTSAFQLGRYSSTYPSAVPIEYDSRIMMRRVISLDIIRHTAAAFARVVAAPGLGKALASFAKSLGEYKHGNYQTSIVLAWFITEAALSDLWKIHIDGLNADFDDGRKRINRDRREFLTGRDFTISIVSNLLELWGKLPHAQFRDIDAVRGFRNKIVHSLSLAPGASEAQLALKTAQAMINRVWKFSFTPSLSYSAAGL